MSASGTMRDRDSERHIEWAATMCARTKTDIQGDERKQRNSCVHVP